MTLLKDNNYKEINVALLSLEADIKNKITNFDTSVIDRQLVEINSRIDKINAGSNNTSATINDIRYEIEDINSKLKDHSTKIENIEQKLADIFSAENKVTDFNTTTNSGVYYWVTDSTNRPTDYGVLLVNKHDGGSSTSIWINQIAYGTNGKIYFRQSINSGNWTEWKAVAFDGEVKSSFLDEYVGAGGTRLTSGNIVPKDSSEYGGMRKDVVTDSMTDSGHPEGYDGHLLTMFWDNTGRYDSQLFVSNSNPPVLKVRAKANGADYGPWVDVIAGNNAGSKLTLQGGTVSSNSYTDTNPKLEFKNIDGSQNISLTFTDFDAVQEPASLTLNGNQGNEYFIAPNIKATGNFYGNLSGKADTAGTAATADSLFYRHGNEINFKGGAQSSCYFNYRNADTDGPSPVATMQYIFCNYSGDTSKSVLKAGSFDGTTAKASSKMVIPIGAPSNLEDGCIWIER